MGKNTLLKTSFLALAFALGVENSLACTYGPPYKTVCETYARADSVIIGKVKSVTEAGSTQKVVVEVERAFKGRRRGTVVLLQPLTTCGWNFSGEVGQTLLLYLARDPKTGKLAAVGEGMGGRVERAHENLYWLNKLPGSLRRTRLSGTVELFRPDPFEFVDYVSGTKVRVFNEKNYFEAPTDKNGVYEIWDIPAGKYRVEPALPPGLKLRLTLENGLVDFDSLRKVDPKTDAVLIEIRPGGCGGIDFVVNEKNPGPRPHNNL